MQGPRSRPGPSVEGVPVDAEWTAEVVPLEPVDELRILTVCDNTVDIFLLDEGPARRLPLGGTGLRRGVPLLDARALEEGKAPDAPLAQHGFSAVVEARKGEVTDRLLFDTGLTPGGLPRQPPPARHRSLGHRGIVCSHGHFDHTTGLSGLMEHVGRANLPVVIHPEFWARRRLAIPGREPFEFPTTSRRALEDAGFDIVARRQPSFLFDRSVLITGEVDRTTGFERGFPIHEARRDGVWEPDPLILDDQALIADVAGRGLVVLTGCGHARVVNTCRYAQRLTGVEEVRAVIGGFHLNGPLFEPVIDDTLDAFEQLAPDLIVPAHCTGWRATHAFARRFRGGIHLEQRGHRLLPLLYEDLGGVVLLGFSYGGFVVTGALQHVHDRVRHLVYLDAFVPDDGETALGHTLGLEADRSTSTRSGWSPRRIGRSTTPRRRRG